MHTIYIYKKYIFKIYIYIVFSENGYKEVQYIPIFCTLLDHKKEDLY